MWLCIMSKYDCTVVEGIGNTVLPALKLRAKVYCKEFGWLQESSTGSSDIEIEDKVDSHSLHMFITTDAASEVAIANLRITPYNTSPMKSLCSLGGEGYWEIGRLCINKDHRGKETRTILTHLFGMLYQESYRRGILGWTAVMSPEVLSLLDYCGVKFSTHLPAIQYHGERIPVAGLVADIAEVVSELNPPMWDKLNEVKYSGGTVV